MRRTTTIVTAATLTAETADDHAVFGLLANVDATRESLPDPNDLAAPNARARAHHDRMRLDRLRDVVAMCWGNVKRKRTNLANVEQRLLDARRLCVLAQRAMDADVAAGRLPPPEKRHHVLFRSYAEDNLLASEGECARLADLASRLRGEVVELAGRFDVAVVEAETALRLLAPEGA